MTVYVDTPTAYGKRVGRLPADTLWCHMWADTAEELHTMATRVGMHYAWFQDHKRLPHYDLVPSKRALAVKAGAVEVGHDFLADWMETHKS